MEGFTLLEIMIAVTILGLLTAFAYPSYVNQIKKSKRTPAKVELMKLAQLQESFFVQNLSYANKLNGASNTGGLGFPEATVKTEGGDYTVSLIATTATGGGCTGTAVTSCAAYFLEALPVADKGTQSRDELCTGLRISNTGNKEAKGKNSSSYGDASVRDECW